MATEAQIAANRRNAQKSTGPRTPRGKRLVARNAITHGLDCRDVLHFDEDAVAFEDYRRKLIADTQPVGGEEQDWVELMVASGWRLRRVFRVETQMHGHQRYRLGGDNYNTGACVLNDLKEEKGFPYVDRKEANLIRQYKLASRELRDLQRLRREGRRHVVEDEAEDGVPAPVERGEPTELETKAEVVTAVGEVKSAEQSQIGESDQRVDGEQSQFKEGEAGILVATTVARPVLTLELDANSGRVATAAPAGAKLSDHGEIGQEWVSKLAMPSGAKPAPGAETTQVGSANW